jgi:hypothetical protein
VIAQPHAGLLARDYGRYGAAPHRDGLGPRRRVPAGALCRILPAGTPTSLRGSRRSPLGAARDRAAQRAARGRRDVPAAPQFRPPPEICWPADVSGRVVPSGASDAET